MVRALQLTLIVAGPAVFFVATAQAQRERRAGDGLVCVNATRDWNDFGATQSLQAARDFLSRRVKPECTALAQRVRSRILALQPAPVREVKLATAAGPRPEQPRGHQPRSAHV